MTDPIARLTAALADRYHIEREIGAGGMATVYLAQDVKHRRRVALKLLRPELGAVLGPERFLSEINVTANLQHPHLLPLFDSGEAEGLLFYVMPYIQGESLRARLERERQLPIDEAIRIATSVASALDYAHRHGVIHRDLKPENILLHDGQPLVTDFGIALAISNAGGARVTQTGLSLGTPQYMSPEQATGDRVIDARSDIYSLAAVLYEMLAGDPPHFAGTTQAIIAKVLTEKPPSIRAFRENVPAHVDATLQIALAKLPADRFASAGEFADALSGKRSVTVAVAATQAAQMQGWRRPRARVAIGALALVTVALLSAAAGARWRRVPDAPPLPVARAIVPLEGSFAGMIHGHLTVSPDGRSVVFSGSLTSDAPLSLLMRRVDDPEVFAIPGTERAMGPRFAPAGDRILFLHGDSLLTIPANGGTPTLILRQPGVRSAEWSADGSRIFFVSARGIFSVGSTGGQPTPIATPDSQTVYDAPTALPDGRSLLFSASRQAGSGEVWADTIRLLDLESGETTAILPGFDVRYAPTGHLLFSDVADSAADASATLFAVPFDLRRRQVSGVRVPVLTNLQLTGSRLAFAVSPNGTAVYHARPASRVDLYIAGGGAPQRLPLDLTHVRGVRVSPDGRRIAYGSNSDIFVFEPATGTRVKIATGWDPVWSPDGARVAYHANTLRLRFGAFDIAADGSGSPRSLFDDARVFAPQSILADGRVLARGQATAGNSDLFLVAFKNDSASILSWLRADWDETKPTISPDQRWVAYRSNESGRIEIYVRSLTDPGAGKWQISENLGNDPVWSRDGRTLYYWEGTTLRAAHVRTTPDFAVLGRVTVLEDPQYRQSCCLPNYDVLPDGGIVIARSLTTQRTASFVLVVNWFEELRSRLASAGNARNNQ